MNYPDRIRIYTKALSETFGKFLFEGGKVT